MSATFFRDPVRSKEFNDAYWAAQSKAVRDAGAIADYPTRMAAFSALAAAGVIIDKAIMIWGWEPYQTMLTRWCYGYTWAPNLNQGNVSVPEVTIPGQAPYDPNNPPKGSIPVHDPNSYDLAQWFPPFDPPVVAPTDAVVLVGDPWPDQGKNAFYATFAARSIPAGQSTVENGHTFVKFIMEWPFSEVHGWRETA